MALGRPIDRPRTSAGQRDIPVTIQVLTDTRGPSGFPVESWTTLVALEWMTKLDLDNTEEYRAGQLSSPLKAVFVGPYRPEMDPELVDVVKTRRLLCSGRIYDITGATQIGRRDELQYLTLAKVG